MEKNKRKQVIITTIYAVLFLLFCGFVFSKIYSWLKPEPTCLDNVQNQNEEGVDCGGVCQNKCAPAARYDLKVNSAGFVESGIAGKYDLYAEVSNPNPDLGASQFQYIFKIKNSSGVPDAAREGTAIILPGETKYIVENNIESKTSPESVELEIKNPAWVEFADYEKPQLKIINKNYNEISSGVGFGEAVGVLRNDSPFDFSTIKIKIILKNFSGEIVALNSTQINTVKSGENREFRALWLSKFPGTVGNMEVQAEVNVFDSDSFAKKYFKAQRFQGYQ